MQRSAVRQWVSFPMAWLIGALALLALAVLAWATTNHPAQLQLEWSHDMVQSQPVSDVLPPPVIEDQSIMLAPAPVAPAQTQVFPAEYWLALQAEYRAEMRTLIAALPHLNGEIRQITRPATLHLSPLLYGQGGEDDIRWLSQYLPIVDSSPKIGNGPNGFDALKISTPILSLGDHQIYGVIVSLSDARTIAQELSNAYQRGFSPSSALNEITMPGIYQLAGLVVDNTFYILPLPIGSRINIEVEGEYLLISVANRNGWHQIGISSSIFN